MLRSILFWVTIFAGVLIAIVPSPILLASLIGSLVSIVLTKNKDNWFRRVFITLDQMVNVYLAPVLNRITDDPRYGFGNPDETVSSVVGKNKRDGHQHEVFNRIDKLLTKLDPGSVDDSHAIDAIEEDEESL